MSGSSTKPVLVLLWRSLGPYHIARAEAAAALLNKEAAIDTVAVELCDQEQTHAWKVDRATAAVKIHTIAPGVKLDGQGPNLTAHTKKALDALQPKYLAIAGYDRREMRAAVAWAQRRSAVKVLMSETKWDDSPRPWWKIALLRRHVSKFDAGLVSGSAAGEFLIMLGMPRARVFRQYGAVDNRFFSCAARRAREQDLWPRPGIPRKYFIVSSRLHEELKNIHHLLLSYERYRAQVNDPWALVICGEGKDRAAYERLVAERGIRDVHFEGFKQADELALYYARATCFIHPAKREAWGLVVNEAMAAGLPVIVARTCGAGYDLVRDGGNGLCFESHDPNSLTASMRRLHDMSQADRELLGLKSAQIISDWGVERFATGLHAAINATNSTVS
jgi:glycosyltransferase involved in cell wall biosynthesis